MRRHLLGLATGSALLMGTLAVGTANAQDTDPADCADARAALTAALDNVDTDAGLSLDLGLDTLSDRLAALDLDADARAALALVADVRTACTDDQDDDVDQGDDQGQDDDQDTPGQDGEPATDDQNDGPVLGGNIDDQPRPGDTCDAFGVTGLVDTDGTCSVGDGTVTNGGQTGGQVTTVPRGHADTGAL